MTWLRLIEILLLIAALHRHSGGVILLGVLGLLATQWLRTRLWKWRVDGPEAGH